VPTPLITTSTNVMSPKIINFQEINLSFTIPNINNEESKTSIWPEIENKISSIWNGNNEGFFFSPEKI